MVPTIKLRNLNTKKEEEEEEEEEEEKRLQHMN
jgi:hypothetical protein